MKKLLFVLACVSVLLFFSGCGGGSGGGDGLDVPSTYDGEIGQATITEANVLGLVDIVWENTRLGVEAEENLPEIDASGILIGDCGGTATATLDDNAATGNYTGTILFTSYCSAGMTIDGELSFSGAYNTLSGEILSIILSFDGLVMSDGVDTFTFVEGTIRYVVKPDMTGETNTLDLVLRDNSQNKTYWLNDFVLELTYGAQDTVTLEGTFYDHDAGYVDISTLVPITVADAGPVAGTLLIAGKASNAKLTFQADLSSFVEFDEDGDGTYVIITP